MQSAALAGAGRADPMRGGPLCYRLSPEEQQRLRSAFEGDAREPFSEANFSDTWTRASCPGHLPSALQGQLEQFASRQGFPGAFLVQGVPLDRIPPVSPVAKYSKQTSLSELALLAVCGVLGTPYGYVNQRDGLVLQNFWPRPEHATLQLGTSDAELIWHSEDAFTAHAPDFIALLCLRGDPDAVTRVSYIDPAAFDAATLEALSTPWYSIQRDSSYGQAAQRGEVAPVLSHVDGKPFVRYEPIYLSFLCERARRAHEELAAYMDRRHVSVVLSAGDLLVVDNRCAVHSRSAIAPRYDGSDRWLQRLAVWRRPPPPDLVEPGRPHVLRL